MLVINLQQKTITILVLVVLLSGAACTTPKQGIGRSGDGLFPPENTVVKYHSDWTKKHYPARIKQFQQDTLHPGDIVMLGNSITEQGGDWSAKLGIAHVHNRGISGDVTDGVLLRLNEITYSKPQAVFVLIGINDLYNWHDKKQIPSVEYIAKNIVAIAKQIKKQSPQTTVYVQTILPTSKPYLQSGIQALNTILKNSASRGKYQVIDLHTQFTDAAGLLSPALTTDGTHLNDSGYRVWANYIQPIAKRN
jgi:lysophospholipase L1-like esterase